MTPPTLPHIVKACQARFIRLYPPYGIVALRRIGPRWYATVLVDPDEAHIIIPTLFATAEDALSNARAYLADRPR